MITSCAKELKLSQYKKLVLFSKQSSPKNTDDAIKRNVYYTFIL